MHNSINSFNPWSLDPGSWIQQPRSSTLDPASWIRAPGYRILDQATRIPDPGSRIQDSQGMVLDLEFQTVYSTEDFSIRIEGGMGRGGIWSPDLCSVLRTLHGQCCCGVGFYGLQLLGEKCSTPTPTPPQFTLKNEQLNKQFNSKVLEPGSRILDNSSPDPAHWIQDPGSEILDTGSWIEQPGSQT